MKEGSGQALPRFIAVPPMGRGNQRHVNPAHVLYIEERRDRNGEEYCALILGPPADGKTAWHIDVAMRAEEVVSIFEGPDVDD